MHSNSRLAYYEEMKAFSKREMLIPDGLLMNPDSHTDRSNAELMGFENLADVQQCITELVARGALTECGDVVCPVTKKLVRTVRISDAFKERILKLKSASLTQPARVGGEQVGRCERYKIPARGQCSLF